MMIVGFGIMVGALMFIPNIWSVPLITFGVGNSILGSGMAKAGYL